MLPFVQRSPCHSDRENPGTSIRVPYTYGFKKLPIREFGVEVNTKFSILYSHVPYINLDLSGLGPSLSGSGVKTPSFVTQLVSGFGPRGDACRPALLEGM